MVRTRWDELETLFTLGDIETLLESTCLGKMREQKEASLKIEDRPDHDQILVDSRS